MSPHVHQKSMEVRQFLGVIFLAMFPVMSGCANENSDPDQTHVAEEAPAAEMEQMEGMMPRVFFVEPADGTTVQSPVRFVFGAEHLTVEPVGEGEVHEGAGHHHLGIDTDCLPAGEVVPQGAPWIHFGDASTEIEMQLEPGLHRFCLQLGDGEHRTIEDISTVIGITVE